MTFNDISFFPFFVAVWTLCFVAGRLRCVRCRNALLLIASYWFYWKFSTTFVAVLAYVTLVNYVAGDLLLARSRKWVLAVAIVLTLLPLLCYKYTNFVVEHVLLLDDQGWSHWAMPVGISFFTLQAMTYTMDIYRKKIFTRAPLVDFALFVAFFPTLLSGPIARARHLLPQFAVPARISTSDVASGIQLFVWGLFKKIVVADRIGTYTGSVFASPGFYGGNTSLLAILLYSVQLYCDFSGYSDMAIGVARMMGFRLRANFLFPFFSTTLRSFWRKWHISLTSWFTEYLYVACGGNRVSRWRWHFNICLVFIVSGLWHGAAWTYIAWGALHALLYVTEMTFGQANEEKEYGPLEALLRGSLIFVGWSLTLVVFRSENLYIAAGVFCGMFNSWCTLYMGASALGFVLMMAGCAVFAVVETLMWRNVVSMMDGNPFKTANLCCMVFLLLAVCLLGRSGAQFVYFKF